MGFKKKKTTTLHLFSSEFLVSPLTVCCLCLALGLPTPFPGPIKCYCGEEGDASELTQWKEVVLVRDWCWSFFWGRFLSFLGPIKHRSYFNLLCWEIKLNRAVKSIGPSKTYLKPSAALLEHKERQFPKLLFQWKMNSRFYNRISSCGKPIRNAFVSELSHWLHPS